jgi:glycine/D-amino acid oxidase-like deaminating enzyme
LTRPRSADVLVVGNGLTGCLVAAELARAGRRVVVVAAAPPEPPPLGLVPSGPTLAYAEAVLRWGPDGARELWSLQRDAQAELRRLTGLWRGDLAWRAAGGFLLARTRAEGAALADSEDMLRAEGFAGEFLDGYMLEARFDVRAFAAGYWAEEEAELDARALADAAAAAAHDAGVTFAGAMKPGQFEVSPEGVRTETGEASARAAVAVVASAAAVEVLPGFERLAAAERHGIKAPLRPEASVPSPARALDGRFAWTLRRGSLELEVFGSTDAEALRAEHLPVLTGPYETVEASPRRLSGDGLPLVGPVPGVPLVAALPAGPDLGWMPLLARWAVSSLLTGRDATPARLRAARTASAML